MTRCPNCTKTEKVKVLRDKWADGAVVRTYRCDHCLCTFSIAQAAAAYKSTHTKRELEVEATKLPNPPAGDTVIAEKRWKAKTPDFSGEDIA